MRSQQDATQDERLVQRYFACLEFTAERFPKHEPDQRPDFRVSTPAGATFYCEVKSLSSPSDETGITHATMGNSVSATLHDAVPQFRSINSARLVPNVLAWVSHSYRFNYQFFLDFVRGHISIDGQPIASLARERFGRAARDLPVVDLHLWFQEDDAPVRLATNPRAFVGSLRRLLDDPPASWRRASEEPEPSV